MPDSIFNPFLSNALAFAGWADLATAGLHCDPVAYHLLRECARSGDIQTWNAWREEDPGRAVWLSGSDLRKLNLEGADLRDAHLELANFYGSNLQKANLRSASLVAAYLSGVPLAGVDFEGADLSGLRARGVVFDAWTRIWHCTIDDRTDFTGTPLDGLRIDPAIKAALLRNMADIKDGDYTSGIRSHQGKDGVVLHLSDLHFGSEENAVVWYGQLAEDLSELGCRKLDAVILSGDIANQATTEEYQAAALFIRKLSVRFGLSPTQVIPVPGNHDVSWSVAKTACDASGAVRDETLYRLRMAPFADFYQSVRGERYPLDPREQALLYHLPSQNLLVLGLNSAWRIDHHSTASADIQAYALANGLEKIHENPDYQRACKIAVWHHPIVSDGEDRIKDHGFLERLAQSGFRIGLHGHIHAATNNLYRYDVSPGGRQIDLCSAGTFGAPTKEWTPGFPLQYQLLKFGKHSLTIETRRREKLFGSWKPDARWTERVGADPVPRYRISL